MRVLVTGGAGFIGSNLVLRLLEEGHGVVVLDNFATGRRENLTEIADDVELVEGDLRSYERVHTAVRGCEVVLHQGALPSVPRSVQDPLTSAETNVTGTLNVLLNARDCGVRRLIFASSSSVYGADPTLPKHEAVRPAPLSPYAVSKLAGEGFCRSFSTVYGLETVALRYFNVFGPRQDPQSQYAAVIPNFVTACRAGTAPTIFGDGEQSRDFTFVDNVVDANLAAMTAPEIGQDVYNIACGERITLNRLLEPINEILGTDVHPAYAPGRSGDIRHSLADIGAARRDLGYEPRIGLVEGLRETIAHLTASVLDRRPA
jgi:nucleoside-diphosphate-sugar epimerase